MICPRHIVRIALATLAVGLMVAPISAAEVHTNGLGGGDWSDPLSWREKAVPTSEDDAVIARGDVLTFDRDDEGTTTCKQIFIDPGGSLTFKTGSGRLLCSVAGAIESFGTILIDGSRSSSDKFELRLVGATPADRMIKLKKGGVLTISGRRNLAHGRHNVTLASAADPESKDTPIEATVETQDGTSLDVQNAELVHTHLRAIDIDNTGAEIGERVNIVGNHFTGLAHLSLHNCDTPLIADNSFEFSGAPSTPNSAIFLNVCQLAEIRDNATTGRYAFGVQGRSMVDGSLTGGTYDGATTGVYWYGDNGMLKDLTIRKCTTGLICTAMTGVVENVRIEACTTGYSNSSAWVQAVDMQIVDVPPKGEYVSFYSGRLRLLNCNMTAEQIVPTKKAEVKTTEGVAPVESLSYLVVRAKGKVPAGARVDVRTADSAEKKGKKTARAADPNVRNSPAPLRFDGLTPLPDSLEPLIVRGWSLDDDFKVVAAPAYVVSVVPAATGADEAAAPKPLVSQTVTPDATWYRAEPNKPEPTLEVIVP